MPYVRVLLSGRSGQDGEFVRRIRTDLPKIIATELAVPISARFPASEVTIDGVFLDGRGDDPTLVPAPRRADVDVAIIIFSNANPERQVDKDDIAARILDGAMAFLPPGHTAYVWLCLQNAGFAEVR